MVVQPVVSDERPVFYRERAAGMYGVAPYSLALVRVTPPHPAYPLPSSSLFFKSSAVLLLGTWLDMEGIPLR